MIVSDKANINGCKVWNHHSRFAYFWREFPFSQWSMSEFIIDGNKYCCNEQWMMAEKAKFFKDDETLKKIFLTNVPSEHKKLGRSVKNFNPEEWRKIAIDVVIKGQKAKFQQNPLAMNELMKYKDCLLVEASPYDKIWGIGMTAEDAAGGKEWRGTNWLGEALTKVKDSILNMDES